MEITLSLEEEALVSNAKVETGLIVIRRFEHTYTVVGLDNDLWQRIVVETKGQLVSFLIGIRCLTMVADVGIIVVVTTEDILFFLVSAQLFEA